MKLVLSEINGCVGRLTLNRPEKRNAVTHAMADDFLAELSRFESAGVELVELRGAGSVFCAGADLEEATADPQNPATERILSSMMTAPIFWVANVHAPALGAGVSIISVCPLALVASSAWMSLPEVDIGLLPTAVIAYIEPAIGSRLAIELGLTGRRVEPDEAVRTGLANEVVSSELLPSRMAEWVNLLSTRLSITRTAGEAWRARFQSDSFLSRKRELDQMLDLGALAR
jgi:enoyl-CoA hydratase/carnithine racemase